MLSDGLNSNFKASPRPKRSVNVKLVKVKKIKHPETPIEFGTLIGDRQVTIMLPLKAMTPNQSEPWRKRHAREKAQKRAVTFALIPVKEIICLPCRLKFTRFGPRLLDAHDNLPMSVKKIVDQTAAEIVQDYRPGLADSNKGFAFEYDQIKSKTYAVKIEIMW